MKHLLQHTLLFTFVFLNNLLGQDNDLRFTHLSSKDGLPHSLIFDIVQDSMGFMWFGTNNGLARYDGYNFKVYQPKVDNENSISSKSVTNITLDNSHQLWLSLSSNGLNRFDIKNNKFFKYQAIENNPNAITSYSMTRVFNDRHNNIWIYTYKGLNKYNRQSNTFEQYFSNNRNENSIPDNQINDIVDDNFGNIWIATLKGVALIDNKTGIIYRLGSMYAKANILNNENVTDVIIDNDGIIWFSTDNLGLVSLNPRTGNINQFNILNKASNFKNNNFFKSNSNNRGDLIFLSNRPNINLYYLPYNQKHKNNFKIIELTKNIETVPITNIDSDSKGNFWISTSFGLLKFDVNTQQLHKFDANINNSVSISSNNLSYVFVDKSDMLWAGIYKVGIDKADLNQKKFNSWVCDTNNPQKSLPTENILSVYEDKNKNIWVGSMDNGISVYNSNKLLIKHWDVDINNPNKLVFNFNVGVAEDTLNNNIWFGSWQGQLTCISTKNYKLTHYNISAKKPYTFNYRDIRKIIIDKKGNIWFAAYNAIIEYDIKQKTFFNWYNYFNYNAINDIFIRTIFIDSNEIIWAGTHGGGLVNFNRETKKYTRYSKTSSDTSTISDNTVYTIVEDKKTNCLWVGTAMGINKFNLSSKTFTRYNTKNGLCNNTVYTITPDKFGFYWLTTDNGLSRFNPNNITFQNYFETDGLISNEFNSNAASITRGGIIYLGTPKGIIYFNPGSIIENKNNVQPVFTNFRIFNNIVSPGDTINNKVVLLTDIAYCPDISLSYLSSVFSIEFASSQYNTTYKTKFKYKLDGFDDDWILTDGQNNRATYTNIPAGTYTFILKTSNINGRWNSQNIDSKLTIIISPPFYKTLWFRILSAVLITLAIYLYYISKIRFYKRNHKKLESMVHTRTIELEETNALLEERQEEINIQKEKLQIQTETLIEINTLLKDQQEKILKQNVELEKHRSHLEDTIIERTREMQLAINRAEESDRLKSEFLANMSHEIRTPMNAIVGFSNLLTDIVYDQNQRDEFIKLIRKNGETLLVLIDDILDLAKIQSKQLLILPRQISIQNLFDDLLEIYTTSLKKENVEIRYKLTDDIIIEVDPIRLKQILTNLISNAVKFTDEGYVEFGAIPDSSSSVKFFVTDTGVGIPSDVGNSIFERFWKLATSKVKFLSGVGLGLAICKSLTELMGGQIWYKSILGKGTSFYFTLPLTQEINEFGNIKNDTSLKIKVPNLKNKTVIIVEDEEANYLVLLAFLAKTGATVIWAQHGAECIELTRTKTPNIIIMDILMPEFDGITATKILKNEFPKIPIIAQTAFPSNNEIDIINNAGFDGYIVKPIKMSQFYSILNTYLT